MHLLQRQHFDTHSKSHFSTTSLKVGDNAIRRSGSTRGGSTKGILVCPVLSLLLDFVTSVVDVVL